MSEGTPIFDDLSSRYPAIGEQILGRDRQDHTRRPAADGAAGRDARWQQLAGDLPPEREQGEPVRDG